jgi:hypothetical protein
VIYVTVLRIRDLVHEAAINMRPRRRPADEDCRFSRSQRAAAVAIVEVLAREIGVDDPLRAGPRVQRGGEEVKAAYQEVVEQMVKVFKDHLEGPRSRDRALALVVLCVGGMVLARNVGDPDLADDFRRAAHAEVLRTTIWN